MQGLLANPAWTERKIALASEAAGNNVMEAAQILKKKLTNKQKGNEPSDSAIECPS